MTPNSQTERGLCEEAAVFTNHTEGFEHLYPAAVACTTNGTLLAFVEAKQPGQPPRFILLRRSSDGGRTWGLLNEVTRSDDTFSIGNVCPAVDRQTGVVWLTFCGRGPERFEDTVFVTHSDDDGQSWSPPVEITGAVKKPQWGYYYTGPGHGIQLRGGRLLFPCHHSRRNSTQKDFAEWSRLAGSHVFYSDDHGESWHVGGESDRFMDECQVVELADGRLLLSMRNYLHGFELGEPLSGSQQRAFATSDDGGLSWSESALNPEVYCSACMGSIHRLRRGADDENRIICSGPGGPGRVDMTVRLSYDEGNTWPVSRVVREGNVAGSDLVVLPDSTIGLLYSHGPTHWNQTSFARVSLDWLTRGREQ